ncbi:hypothetical protein K2173_013616 [Erythroxylum novogranatense]|uniref:Uncharacterized protein n=1 Tax=Erythroxylum novogranatense TaxID=1862640 RepID=A0AAV8TMR8_9ROSI|nr:hypothetical protein K2173_013616 [Erythroxylum novogranatense]
MGACATKPKVAKDDEGKAPVPPPETVKEEVAADVKKEEVTGVAEEEKKVVEREVGDQGHGKVKDVDDDHKVDDDSSKRRSLSNLFKEKSDDTRYGISKTRSLYMLHIEKYIPLSTLDMDIDKFKEPFLQQRGKQFSQTFLLFIFPYKEQKQQRIFLYLCFLSNVQK